MSRPAGYKRLAHTSFPCIALGAAEQTRSPAILILRYPRTVIAGKYHESIVGKPELIECLVYLSHAPVKLFDNVTVQSAYRGVLEFFRCVEGNMWKGIRQIYEKRPVPVLFDEF